MADIRHAQCHCGAVAFTVELSDGLNTARQLQLLFLPDAGRRGGLGTAVGHYRNERGG